MRLAQERCEATVQGSWEAFLTGDGDLGAAQWWRDELTPEQVAWLAALRTGRYRGYQST